MLDAETLAMMNAARQNQLLEPLKSLVDDKAAEAAIHREAELGYMAENGRYWEMLDRFDAQELQKLDALWLAAIQDIEADDAGSFRTSIRGRHG